MNMIYLKCIKNEIDRLQWESIQKLEVLNIKLDRTQRLLDTLM